MNNSKGRLYRWRICTSCMFIAVVYLLSGLGSNYHVRQPTHHREDKRTQVLGKQAVVDMQEIGHIIAQRQTQYRAGLFRIQSQANALLDQLQQEVIRWGNAHLYHDPYNGVAYKADYEYESFGWVSYNAVKNAHTMSDYGASINLISANLMHLRGMEADYADKTVWNHPHASDLRLIHYHHLSGQVIVISFIKQACRVYQNGKLVKAFLITSGRPTDPSPAGLWNIFVRKSPTVFRSNAPVGSADWYPVTPIEYAMEYHTGGYYLHDSWWRAYYGPGTNFPHYDPDGEQFAGSGSHGCINMPTDAAAWMYANTGYGTPVLTY